MGNSENCPNVVSEIKNNNGRRANLSHKAIAELDNYFGWKNGTLDSGTNFSKHAKQITC